MNKISLLSAMLLATACASTPPASAPSGAPSPVTPVAAPRPAPVMGLDGRIGLTLDSLMEAGIAAGAAPGAALAVGRHGRIVHMRSYGRIDVAPAAAAVTDSTRYDLASLTKVVATTTAAMILEEAGLLNIDRPVHDFLPQINAPEKAGITVRQLLAHNGGFRSGAPLWRESSDAASFLRAMNERPLAYTPGDSTIYSDWDLIMTGLIVEHITGEPLDVFLQKRVWGPLGMRDTGFNPLGAGPLPIGTACTAMASTTHPLLPLIAATEIDTVYRKRQVHGIVHDENACALGGVAGHAGLFSSARDLAVFATMMLNGGEYNGVRILKATTIARWTARQGPRSSRALGWDTPAPGSSAGRFFSPRSFGHTGFTGTSIWMDPEKGIYVVLLTNRVNPTRANNKHEPLRRAIADAVQQAVMDAPVKEWNPPLPPAPPSPAQARVLPGLDIFLADVPAAIRGKRIGLITNGTVVDRQGRLAIDLIAAHKDLKLVALFAPEHGIRGTVAEGATIEDERDAKTGVPVYSLYKTEDHGPEDAMLADVDALVYDLQEVGGRTWTYVSTMALSMMAAKRKGIPFVVLDRPNPIGGEIVEGAPLDPKFKSFVGMYSIPARHGMTVGELARLFNTRFGIGANLIVIKAANWKRSMWFEDNGVPWANPSPNLRTPDALKNYPGTVYFEGTNLSEGRGSERPFEQVGAPWLKAQEVMGALNAKALPGVRFEAITMTIGVAAKYKGQTLPGIRFVVTDRNAYRPVRTALIAIDEIRRQHPADFKWSGSLDRLAGTDRVRLAIEAGTLPALLDEWDREAAQFKQGVADLLMYR
jgi:uncharacterized protein YbbC (DUF1343 family)/CubicO group peptidase (beta-lactamase class C family)